MKNIKINMDGDDIVNVIFFGGLMLFLIVGIVFEGLATLETAKQPTINRAQSIYNSDSNK